MTSPSLPARPSVAVVGGGWAGIAAAVELAANGYAVELFESARQLGGRARRAPFGTLAVDNGQHLLIGAYRETLRLLELMGAGQDAFVRLPLHLDISGTGTRLQLRASRFLPAPLHIATGLLRMQGVGLRERFAALRFAALQRLRGFRLRRDLSVSRLLSDARQPASLVASLWEPLCLAALNTPAERASAQVFLRVLKDAFGGRREDSDLLIPAGDLSRLFPDPAMEYIESCGGHVRLGARVTGLAVRDERCTGVITEAGPFEADHVVVAVPSWQAQRLFAEHAPLRPLADHLAGLGQEPIATVYLRYPPEVRAEAPMCGMLGTLGQWLFDRSHAGQPGVMAVVISGPGEHMSMAREQLAQRVSAELAERYPHWPDPTETLVIREKRATFSCGVDVKRRRPAHQTPVDRCWLAGDFTENGYPATLEGAVRSGVQCARLIMAETERAFLN